MHDTRALPLTVNYEILHDPETYPSFPKKIRHDANLLW